MRRSGRCVAHSRAPKSPPGDMGSTDKGKVKESKAQEDEPQNSSEGVVKSAAVEFDTLEQRMAKSHCCHNCFKALFVVLSIVTLLKSIAEIAVTVTTAIATKLYGSEESGRLVGMIILSLLAAVTVSILIYALVAVFRNQARPLHAASIVLFVVAAIQAVVVGVAVRVSAQDEMQLTRSLQASFELSRENNPRHAALWSATQYELNCCGVYGPDDYRSSNLPDYFAPNVPISCCPSYDPDRSELIQEREREICKSRKAYYDVGCRGLVVEGFKTSAHLVLGCTIALIILEILLSIISAILVRKIQRNRNERSAEPEKVASTSP